MIGVGGHDKWQPIVHPSICTYLLIYNLFSFFRLDLIVIHQYFFETIEYI